MSASAYTNKKSLVTRLVHMGFPKKGVAPAVARKMKESGRPASNFVKSTGKVKAAKKTKSTKPKKRSKSMMTTGVRFVW